MRSTQERLGVDVEQVHAREQRARRVHVHVRVVEAGRDEGAREVDGARPRPRSASASRRGAHGGDPVAVMARPSAQGRLASSV
jgi:hypothetical protein